ncbi:MAG: zinc ribbon domain-containing protein [Hyphomicrobiales bacterium]
MVQLEKDPTPQFTFATLSKVLAEKLKLPDIPYPVRKTMVSTVFGPDEVRLRDVLFELDEFVKQYPLSVGNYREAAGTLSMIAATENIDKGNLKSALMCLSVGLRFDPGNMMLRTHQALALQMNGYHGAAADEYAQILNHAPQAYDPSIRALAAKAFAAAGEWDAGLRVLMFLPEIAFEDEGLSDLRAWLQKRGETVPETPKAEARFMRFCTECGSRLMPEQKFCTNCGRAISAK